MTESPDTRGGAVQVPAGATETLTGATKVPAGGTETLTGTAPVPAGAPVAGVRVIGFSLGHRETSEADHWILSLRPAPVLACTHLVRVPFPHVAITLTAPSAELPAVAPELQPAADLAAAGNTGRAVLFPGVENLVGTVTVEQALASSAIDRIEVLGGGVPAPETLLETGDFVRPHYRAGALILTVMPAAGGRLVPFETRNPTPCCGAH